MMRQLDLTIQVLNLSPSVTLAELTTFFSYCGTVEKIQIHKNQDQSLSALVTFLQPYAYQTALLLNGALLGGQQICILSLQDRVIPITGCDQSQKHAGRKLIPAVQSIASKGVQMLNKTKEGLEEKYKVSEKGRMVMEQTKSAIDAAGLAAQGYIWTGAAWLSSTVDKASKRGSAALGTRKSDNPNSRKQK
ncbi:hypothetical protein Tsubulata_000731 [Turnera subulata]|uniref:RRM domain-containing protein n=1 Tax=Turnera subulata TaxID=218843 RepID=A0A9Q0J2V2_9ROSI|nr:hypothetical protein Tsubulata_000731 [Turnera subulata]